MGLFTASDTVGKLYKPVILSVCHQFVRSSHPHTLVVLGKILGKCGILKYLCYSQVFPVYANLYFFSSTFQSETLYFLTPKVIKYIIKLSHNIQQLKLAPPRPATTLN